MRVNDFEQARARALAWAGDSFISRGTLAALDSGQEDDWYFRVVLGAREWLVGRDPLFAPAEEPVILVEKATGRVSVHSFAEAQAGLSLMRPVGAGEVFDPVPAEEAKRRARRSVEARLARRRRFKGK